MALLRNVSWSALSQGVCVAIQFALSVILARLLTPDDFGLLGLAAVFTGFAALFADFGLAAAVIHTGDATHDDLSFVFWLNVTVGILLTAVLVACAPAVAWFYGEPRLWGITCAIAAGFTISATGNLAGSLLNRSLDFGKIAFVDFVSASAAGSLGVYLAYHGFGVYSLVLMSLASQLLRAVLTWYLAGWRPGFPRWSPCVRRMISYGGNLFGFNAINYWVRNGDNLLVGKFCGAWELGIYSRAYSLLLFPVNQAQQVLGRVMFPTLSRLQDAREDFRRLYLIACQGIALVMFPVMTGLLVVADDFVLALYGTKWVAAIPVVRVLAVAGLGNSVGTTVGWIYSATGRTDLMFRWVLFAGPVTVLSFVLGLRWGALGVATAYTIATYLILWYPLWRIPGRLIGLSFRSAMTNVSLPLVSSVVMGLIVLSLKLSLRMAPVGRLMVCSVVGAALYVAVVHALQIDAYVNLKGRVHKFLAPGQPQLS